MAPARPSAAAEHRTDVADLVDDEQRDAPEPLELNAVHADAASIEATDWSQIVALYEFETWYQTETVV